MWVMLALLIVAAMTGLLCYCSWSGNRRTSSYSLLSFDEKTAETPSFIERSPDCGIFSFRVNDAVTDLSSLDEDSESED